MASTAWRWNGEIRGASTLSAVGVAGDEPVASKEQRVHDEKDQHLDQQLRRFVTVGLQEKLEGLLASLGKRFLVRSHGLFGAALPGRPRFLFPESLVGEMSLVIPAIYDKKRTEYLNECVEQGTQRDGESDGRDKTDGEAVGFQGRHFHDVYPGYQMTLGSVAGRS